jgi:hypothetical protein
MKLRDLVRTWEDNDSDPRAPERYCVRLPIHDAAKVAALSEMYPGRSEEDILTDILAAALDEVEAAFPYIQGQRVVAEDEEGDPLVSFFRGCFSCRFFFPAPGETAGSPLLFFLLPLLGDFFPPWIVVTGHPSDLYLFVFCIE